MEWFTKEVLEILKMLNWQPKCIIVDCYIPCEHLNKSGAVLLNATSDKGTYSDICDYFNGFCCSHWEYAFGDLATYFECKVCRSVSWFAGKVNSDQDRINQKPMWVKASKQVLEYVKWSN